MLTECLGRELSPSKKISDSFKSAKDLIQYDWSLKPKNFGEKQVINNGFGEKHNCILGINFKHLTGINVL